MTEGQKSHACSLERDQNHAVGGRFQEFCLIDYSGMARTRLWMLKAITQVGLLLWSSDTLGACVMSLHFWCDFQSQLCVLFNFTSFTAGFSCPQMAKLICSIKEPCQTLVSFIELAVYIGIPQLIWPPIWLCNLIDYNVPCNKCRG
jgi:hypothetical protein